VEFAHIADRLFSGFETKEGFNMALPEKRSWTPSIFAKEFPFTMSWSLTG
jgi:hypothetical protein